MADERPKITLNDFRDHTVCPSCHELYDNPQLLPCLDSLCQRCMPRPEREQNRVEPEEPQPAAAEAERPQSPVRHENFQCPKECCRKKFDGNNVTSNTFLKGIVETIKLQHDLSEGKRMPCDACRKRDSAVAICLEETCKLRMLCEVCRNYHENERDMQHHVLLEVGTLIHTQRNEAAHDIQQDIRRKAWRCDRHREQLMRMYCAQHKEVTCLVCCHDEHRHCDCESVEKIFTDENPVPEMQRNLQELQRKSEELRDAITHITNMRHDLKQNEQQVKTDIDQRFQDIVDKLTQQQERLKQKATDIFEAKARVFDEQLEVLEEAHRNVSHSLKFIEDSINISTNVEFLFLKHHFEARMAELHSILTDTPQEPLENSEMTHSPPVCEIDNVPVNIALGNVYSTPMVCRFTTDRDNINTRIGKDEMLTITARDAGENRVKGCVLPQLQAKLIAGQQDGNVNVDPERQSGLPCKVEIDIENGTYSVSVYPKVEGNYQLYVYHKRPNPFGAEVINNRNPIRVTVNDINGPFGPPGLSFLPFFNV